MKKPTLFFIFAAFAVGVIFFCALIQSDPVTAEVGPEGDPLLNAMGTAKEALGDVVFMKADSYLHGGLRPDLMRAVHESGEEHSDESYDQAFKNFLNDNWTNRIYAQINVVEHKHLEGDESKEILPLLAAATALDTHNVTAFLTTSYWVGKVFGNNQKAIEILAKGEKENPGSWEISNELGGIYLYKEKNYRLAARYFREALKKLDREKGLEYTFFDPIRVRYGLAEAYFNLGLKNKALIFYREAVRCYPPGKESALKSVIEKKINAIRGW